MTPKLEEEVTTLEVVNADIVFQQNKAEIDIQIATAKTYPRNVQRAIDNSIAIVTMDEATAKTCNYTLPRGGSQISGPSVHLAKILAQNWGNMRIDAKVIDIGPKQITSQAVAFDLENNLAIRVEVKRSIVKSGGQRFNDDMITMTGNAANAIALRNAVFAVIPRAVVDKAYNASKLKITGDLSDEQKLIAKRKQVLDGLKDTYGVTEQEALAAIGRASVKHITGDDVLALIGMGQAIKDGDTTVETAFKQPTIEKNKKETQKEKIKNATSDPVKELKDKIDACKTQDELDDLYSATPEAMKTQDILDYFMKNKKV